MCNLLVSSGIQCTIETKACMVFLYNGVFFVKRFRYESALASLVRVRSMLRTFIDSSPGTFHFDCCELFNIQLCFSLICCEYSFFCQICHTELLSYFLFTWLRIIYSTMSFSYPSKHRNHRLSFVTVKLLVSSFNCILPTCCFD